jgi:hypothetical protein
MIKIALEKMHRHTLTSSINKADISIFGWHSTQSSFLRFSQIIEIIRNNPAI